MDTEVLVGNRFEDGKRLVAELVRDGIDVAVAFWVKTENEGLWYLYVGTSAADVQRIGDAYVPVYACLSRIPDSSIALSDIKLISPANPVARAAMVIRDRSAARIPIRFQGERLEKLAIEEAYIYPRVAGPMSRDEVLQTVIALMNRSGPLQSSKVTLHDGSVIQAVPVSIDMKSPGAVYISLRDAATGVDRMVSADDVANIQ
jgi:hypothetical protein